MFCPVSSSATVILVSTFAVIHPWCLSYTSCCQVIGAVYPWCHVNYFWSQSLLVLFTLGGMIPWFQSYTSSSIQLTSAVRPNATGSPSSNPHKHKLLAATATRYAPSDEKDSRWMPWVWCRRTRSRRLVLSCQTHTSATPPAAQCNQHNVEH
jgi:hypothetical protein